MTDPIVVVGSGASGVHFALTALRKGRRVLMLDVGRQGPQPINPGDDFSALKATLPDPAEYFLGRNFEALILPGYDSEYYGFPPAKNHVFVRPEEFPHRATGFSPLMSFAAGGLAEAWTGGCYPFNEEDLRSFSFRHGEMEPFYAEVARRIGISGVVDDLARFFPVHDALMDPLDLDEHSAKLLAAYQRHRSYLNGKLHCYVGRARVAALTRTLGLRKPCNYLGRCLWGCPDGSFYTPSLTLRECRQHPNFEYVDQICVSHFRFGSNGKVTKVIARSVNTGQTQEISAGTLVLAGGTLSSSRIFLESIYRDSGEILQLRGLMDNRQVLIPFVNLRLLGRGYSPKSYQYHQIAMGIAGEPPDEYVHALVTTLKTALIHPIVQSLPFGLGPGIQIFRRIHAALGLVNVNFADHRREENYLALEADRGSGDSRLLIHYRPAPGESSRLQRTKKIFQRVLWKLDCVAPSGMMHVRPMGASVHYAGTIPIAEKKTPLTSSKYCQSYDFENLYFVDGTTFPVLPAKNITFTLMANAVRVASIVC